MSDLKISIFTSCSHAWDCDEIFEIMDSPYLWPPSPIPLSENHAGSQLELRDEILSGVWSSHRETLVALHAFHQIPALPGATVTLAFSQVCAWLLGMSLLCYFGIESLASVWIYLFGQVWTFSSSRWLFPPRLVPVTRPSLSYFPHYPPY